MADSAALTPRTLLRIKEVEALTGVPEDTLRYWRWKGTGPASYKIGRRVVYDRGEVEAWLDAARKRGGARRA